jgi:hypothetical protein
MKEVITADGIKSILETLEVGDEVLFEAGGWRRKQPLTVTGGEHGRWGGYLIVESGRGTEYDLVYGEEGRGPYVPDQGDITWLKVK